MKELIQFQFDDDGVLREAIGTYEGTTAGGMAICRIEHSNVDIITLPNTIRPANFSHKGLKQRIRLLITSELKYAWIGQYPKEDHYEIENEVKDKRKKLKEYIEWMKL